MNQLYSILSEAGLLFKSQTEYGEVDSILLEIEDDGATHSVDLITFETLFGDVKGNPNYDALSGSHTFKLGDMQYTMTAEEMGYQKYFDKWKEQGLFD